MKKIIIFFSFCFFVIGRNFTLQIMPENLFFISSPLVLEMIINHRAKINGKWYDVGNKLDYFVIEEISTHSVTLRDIQNEIFKLRYN